MLLGIHFCELDRIGRRIDDANIHPSRLVLERAAVGAGNSHHVAESGENHIRIRRDSQRIVNAPHGKNANRTSGAVNQFDICRQNIFQTEAIDGVGVSAADFHKPVVPIRIGQPSNFVGGLGDQFRIAKFVHVFHFSTLERTAYGACLSSISSSPYPRTSWIGCFALAEHFERSHLIESIHFADFAHGESDVNQDPVAGHRPVVFEQPQVNPAPHADNINER